MPGSLLGNVVPRVEDPDLLRGRSTFVDNQRVEGTAHAVFVRSPFAHARVTGIDTSLAEAAPGVLAVHTGATIGDRPVPAFADVNKAVTRTALATDEVRYVGDPVALVVAETRAQAVDAAELVDVDYDELPVVVDMEAALAPDAPVQFASLGTNVAASRAEQDPSDPLAGAQHVVRLRVENQRIATAPMEGHAILAQPTDDGLTVWVATQQPHLSRDLIARWTGLDKAQVRVIAPHVGGAFGGKAGITPDHAAVIGAARALGRPVKWTETRSEAMLSMHGRGQVQYAELGLDGEGRFVGLRVRVVGDCGAYAGFGGALALGPTYMMIQGPYEVPEIRYDAIAALTNTAPVGAFRGAGRPEAAALLERLVDLAADELGLAPEEIRRRNLIAPDKFPYRTRTGVTYDVADFDLPLREALRIADVDAARAEQQRRRAAGEVRQLGIGIAVYVEITGFGGSEFGSLHVHEDGTATIMAGTSGHGQGHATSFAMIAADRLGIPMEDFTYVQSDTALVRSGGGTGGSRSLQLGGNAVGQAADEVRVKALDVAARMLEADPADVVLEDGVFGVRGVAGTGVRWAELAAWAHEHDGGLGSDTDFTQKGATFPFGAHVSIVEVDTETGLVTPLRHVAVDDCGRVLSPLIVAGQQHGGAVQGISQALWEQFVYDEHGTPLTSTFADYAMPTTADTIALEVSNTETPTPLNPLGAKGIGESATIGSTPAVQNAVVDALRHLGVRHVDMPCTPERVWRAVRDAAAEGGQRLWREPPAAFGALSRGGDADTPEAAEI
ncbi:xanthine dehydrogenase family protein molybdopterin-binding subunit [Nocardioides sp. MAHUQ-72]|uniref:xanthine dehydrogenase family protein molybdopterin-binding subunit n=1 Tax=unclassified Nocardioides TaxID=2615069 RepID=UPI00360A792B